MIFSLALAVPVTLQSAMLILAAYIISWSLGYIVPGAPGGLGVREMALLLILGPVYNNEIVVVAMILHRISSILGDVIAFLFEVIFSRNEKKRQISN
jgi:uncharacterized membrane protein YbhN (UPF0104 family)